MIFDDIFKCFTNINEDHFHGGMPTIGIVAAIPLKSNPMSPHLLEMPAECQTVQMCLPLALRWHCADFNLTVFVTMMTDVTESARTHVIQNPKAKYRILY